MISKPNVECGFLKRNQKKTLNIHGFGDLYKSKNDLNGTKNGLKGELNFIFIWSFLNLLLLLQSR